MSPDLVMTASDSSPECNVIQAKSHTRRNDVRERPNGYAWLRASLERPNSSQIHTSEKRPKTSQIGPISTGASPERPTFLDCPRGSPFTPSP